MLFTPSMMEVVRAMRPSARHRCPRAAPLPAAAEAEGQPAAGVGGHREGGGGGALWLPRWWRPGGEWWTGR
jgi:hypothetical protein